MKLFAAVAALLLADSPAFAAVKTIDVRRRPVDFRMEIVSDRSGVKPETYKNGRPFVAAHKDENYSIRLYNPLPVRVAVNLTVDGVNSISGKPSGIEDGQKWLIEPYGFIELRGWQVNGEESRRFFFTDKPKSYAKWRGDRLGKDLAANCGVIGAAYFWNQAELNRHYETRPIHPYRGGRWAEPAAALGAAAMENDSFQQKSAAARGDSLQAGTGMGERESHPTTQVDFHYDAGMYSLSQALVVYYDFAPEPAPNPFPQLSYAPEMP